MIEGIIAILLGLYLLFGGDAAANNFVLVAAIYMLIAGIIELFRGTGTVSRYKGIVGVIVGALMLLFYAFGILGAWEFSIFAIGAIIVGAMGLYSAFFARSGRSFEWGPVIVNALLVLWGVLILFTTDLQTISGWILIAIGVIIALWGFVSRGNDDTGEDTIEDTTSAQDVVEDLTSADDASSEDSSEDAA